MSHLFNTVCTTKLHYTKMIEGLRQQLHLYLILRTHFVEGPKLKSSLKAFIVSIYLVLTWCILCLSIIVHIISHFNTLYLINGFNTFVFIKVFINNYNNYLCFFFITTVFYHDVNNLCEWVNPALLSDLQPFMMYYVCVLACSVSVLFRSV